MFEGSPNQDVCVWSLLRVSGLSLHEKSTSFHLTFTSSIFFCRLYKQDIVIHEGQHGWDNNGEPQRNRQVWDGFPAAGDQLTGRKWKTAFRRRSGVCKYSRASALHGWKPPKSGMKPWGFSCYNRPENKAGFPWDSFYTPLSWNISDWRLWGGGSHLRCTGSRLRWICSEALTLEHVWNSCLLLQVHTRC